MGMPDTIDFSEHYSGWVANAIRKGSLSRDEIWTVELAVGSKTFVDMLWLRMGAAPLKCMFRLRMRILVDTDRTSAFFH